jgi:hypothetical protein
MPLAPTGNDSGAPQFWHGTSPPAISSLRPHDSQTTACAPHFVIMGSRPGDGRDRDTAPGPVFEYRQRMGS